MATGDHLILHYQDFTHHALDLGDGTVAEYSGKGTGRRSVRWSLRAEFLARGPVTVKYYPPGTALPPEVSVGLAWARLREQRYSVFNNNCEHFVNHCKTGIHYSTQAERLKWAVTIGALCGVVALASASDD